jgi:hypothetical protein
MGWLSSLNPVNVFRATVVAPLQATVHAAMNPTSKANILQVVSGGVSTGFKAVTTNLPVTGISTIDKGSSIAQGVSVNANKVAPFVALAVVGGELLGAAGGAASKVGPNMATATEAAVAAKGVQTISQAISPSSATSASPVVVPAQAPASSSVSPLVLGLCLLAVKLFIFK